MSEERKARRPVTSNDIELIVITSGSVHTPGEKAKSRPANRPRPRIELTDPHAGAFIDVSDQDTEGPNKKYE